MSKKVMLSVNELIEEISCRDGVFMERGLCRQFFPTKKEQLLYLILTRKFIDGQNIDFQENLSGRLLNDLLNAKDGKSAVVGERNRLACIIGGSLAADGVEDAFSTVSKALEQFHVIFSPANMDPGFKLKHLPRVYEVLVNQPVRPISWITQNSSSAKKKEFQESDMKLDTIRKSILHLYGTRQYSRFFWWLFLFAMFQSEIVHFLPHIPQSQYGQVVNSLDTIDRNLHEIRWKSSVQVSHEEFVYFRRKIVETAEGHLIIAGPSLKNAFDIGNSWSIIKQLRSVISSGKLHRLTVMLTDPLIFQDTRCYAPVRDIDGTVSSLEDNFYELCKRYSVELHVVFLMLPQIDHAVISEEFMLFRSNKLWTDQRELKGSYMLYTADYYTPAESEYKAHVDYLNLIMSCCNDSHPEIDVDSEDWDRQDTRYYHRQWRKHLRTRNYQHVHFHYLHRDQLHRYMCRTWLPVLD